MCLDRLFWHISVLGPAVRYRGETSTVSEKSMEWRAKCLDFVAHNRMLCHNNQVLAVCRAI
jgi:hypothetical protein